MVRQSSIVSAKHKRWVEEQEKQKPVFLEGFFYTSSELWFKDLPS